MIEDDVVARTTASRPAFTAVRHGVAVSTEPFHTYVAELGLASLALGVALFAQRIAAFCAEDDHVTVKAFALAALRAVA